jgi:hypothetical protein
MVGPARGVWCRLMRVDREYCCVRLGVNSTSWAATAQRTSPAEQYLGILSGFW